VLTRLKPGRIVPRTPAVPSLAARIQALERELANLRQWERLVQTIAGIIGPGIGFSAGELFEFRLVVPELAAAFAADGIENARVLGVRLRQLCGSGLMRVGIDKHGVLWMVE
jgi:hypothetical protein